MLISFLFNQMLISFPFPEQRALQVIKLSELIRGKRLVIKYQLSRNIWQSLFVTLWKSCGHHFYQLSSYLVPTCFLEKLGKNLVCMQPSISHNRRHSILFHCISILSFCFQKLYVYFLCSIYKINGMFNGTS